MDRSLVPLDEVFTLLRLVLEGVLLLPHLSLLGTAFLLLGWVVDVCWLILWGFVFCIGVVVDIHQLVALMSTGVGLKHHAAVVLV